MTNFMSTKISLLDAAYNSCHAMRVRRFHSVPTATPVSQSVGEHTAGVALLVELLYRATGDLCPGYVLLAALLHDMAELETGDIPAPVKAATPGAGAKDVLVTSNLFGYWPELNKHERDMLKLADLLEGYIYSAEHPDHAMCPVAARYARYIEELIADKIAAHDGFDQRIIALVGAVLRQGDGYGKLA